MYSVNPIRAATSCSENSSNSDVGIWTKSSSEQLSLLIEFKSDIISAVSGEGDLGGKKGFVLPKLCWESQD